MARSPYPAPVVIQMRVSMAWQKQALHREISEPKRIRHPVRHTLHKLLADGYF